MGLAGGLAGSHRYSASAFATPFDAQFNDVTATGTISWVGSVMTIVHGVGSLNPTVTVRNPSGVLEPNAGPPVVVDANTVTIDFAGFGVATPLWRVHVTKN